MGACVCVCLALEIKTGLADIDKLSVPHPKDRGQPSHLFAGTFVSAALHHCVAPSATQDNTTKKERGGWQPAEKRQVKKSKIE